MNKIKFFASTLLLVVMGFMFVTCSESNEENDGVTNKLKSYMWEYREVSDLKDHNNGVYYETTSDRFYFMDNNICYHLTVVTDHDSYFGDSQDSYLYEYTYSVSGSTVKVFDEDMNKIRYTLKYRGNYLISDDDCMYEPSVEMTQSQKDYIRRKAQEMHEEEENEEISSSIYDYVYITDEYNEEALCLEFTIKTELEKEFPGKSFKYGIEYGYGNYANTDYCQMSGRNSVDFYTPVIFDAMCYLNMESYKALREKIERGEQLSESEIGQLKSSVNYIEANVKKFKARYFVEFDGDRYYFDSSFYVTIDLDESYNNPNTGGGNNGNSQATGTVQGHAYVDLGLSVKWATCNVGASKPEDYGDYYAWGETTTKSDYDWDTYKWCKGTYKTMTKYCMNSNYGTVDNRTTLTSSDDVATVKWGSKWRMPTKEEMKELDEDCTWTWTTQNGVRGMKVKGPNGNSIFLSAAGYRYGTDLRYRGSYGYYWSATLRVDISDAAYNLYFDDGGSRWYGNWDRFIGHTVRPVTE